MFGVEVISPGRGGDRDRGSGHPLSPPTPPYMRVRIRRFDKVELTLAAQPGESECIEIGIG
ncbi:MAG TPA: hypothetical protein VG649_24640, partial [Candidatus Angelobacter sp.]|nr:hypothetical protein [Candidatus Angelobacter sp.]